MKRLVVVLMMCVVVTAAQAIIVENAGFDQPGTGKIKGWNGENGTDIPGWQSDGAAVDSGVEADGGTPDGDGWRGFLMVQDDPAVYQITSEVITEGTTYTLSVDLRSTWKFDAGIISLIADESSTVLASFEQTGLYVDTSTDTWVTASLSYTAAAADAGKLLGIMIDTGTDADNYGWMGMDNVTLVPEPATLAILGLGSLLIRRKR